jgi:hypothetical protein
MIIWNCTRRQVWWMAVITSITSTGVSPAQAVQMRIPGDVFVTYGKDQTGLRHYVNGGALCVVHRPGCSGNPFIGMFGVGHNGKDHFFPKDKQLPAGVKLIGVQYKMYWPPGLTKTDRGDAGSKGSYGASADKQLQAKPPLYSVHWENACQRTNSADWGNLPVTYQVFFIIDVPASVTVPGAAPYSSADPVQDICHAEDIPTPVETGPSVVPTAVYLTPYTTKQVVWFGGQFGVNTSGTILTIDNAEQFPIEIIADQNMPGGCGKLGNKSIPTHGTIKAADVYGARATYPKTIGACLPAADSSRQSTEIVLTYAPK